ncbi:hypothetical protein JXO59_04020 [candidate division KSB1 bacterium]|nr:hypothetical protein [candidate division KSB1 bacterium]
MREAIVYQPEDRRIVERNLYCPYCGNTNQWQIDLRLWHEVELESGSLTLALDESKTTRILSAIERHIDRMVFLSSDRNKPFLHCANCSNAALDMHEQML